MAQYVARGQTVVCTDHRHELEGVCPDIDQH